MLLLEGYSIAITTEFGFKISIFWRSGTGPRTLAYLLEVAHRLQSVRGCAKLFFMNFGGMNEQRESRSLLA